MIHVLVACPSEGPVAGLPSPRSSVEALFSRGADETVDRLARNRRIDAVLLLAGSENEEIAAAIREDSIAPPPLFLAASARDLAGARRLPSDALEDLLDLVAGELASG